MQTKYSILHKRTPEERTKTQCALNLPLEDRPCEMWKFDYQECLENCPLDCRENPVDIDDL